MWHLHTGRPERCLDAAESRDDLARRASGMPNTILCESTISSAQCASALADLLKRRRDAAGEQAS